MAEQAGLTTDPMLMSIKTAAEYMGLGPYEVKTLVDAGRLPAERIGRAYYIPAQAVRAFIEGIGASEATA